MSKGSLKQRVKATMRQVTHALQASLSHRERKMAAATLDDDCTWDNASLASSQVDVSRPMTDYVEGNRESHE
jgi:hypothetical protein